LQKQGKIVNNESAEVIRILYTAFDDLLPDGHAGKGLTYYPASHAKEIDELNAWIYDQLNNGVYKAGFAATQEVRSSRPL
jgi:putative glutathione S-transferase